MAGWDVAPVYTASHAAESASDDLDVSEAQRGFFRFIRDHTAGLDQGIYRYPYR
jgi:hypothetical protein